MCVCLCVSLRFSLSPVRAAISVNRVEVDVPAHAMLYELSVMRAQTYPTAPEPPKLTPSSTEYYPRVVVTALMRILLDPTLSIHHPAVSQAVMSAFQFLGMQCHGAVCAGHHPQVQPGPERGERAVARRLQPQAAGSSKR